MDGLKNYALYGGITKEEYEEVQPDLLRKNLETLRLSSVMCTILFLALLIGCLFSDALAQAMYFYAAMTVISGVICVLSYTRFRNLPRTILPLWYLLFAAMGSYAVLLNTWIRPELSAVTLCAFLVAGPLLIIDRPWRVVTFQLVLSLIFTRYAAAYKTPELAFADDVNVACCLFLGTVIYIRLNRVKMREALQARLLMAERDTDRLTGLLNKAAVEERIRKRMADRSWTGVMVVMDVDNFKGINDTYGHAYGDMVLRKTADCIRKTAPEDSLCGRFGGDEFLLFLPGLSEQTLAPRLDGLLEELSREMVLPQGMIFSASLGAAVFHGSGETYETLFHRADAALYEAKRKGKNGWSLAEGCTGAEARDR